MVAVRKFVVGLAATFVTSYASAALIDRGGGLIYDSDLNITWLQNANISGGTWQAAMDAAASFAYFDSVRSVVYDDWRLPTTLIGDPTCGPPYGTYNCTGSEMGHLFYVELGNLGHFDPSGTLINTGWGLVNTGPFQDLAPRAYWSATNWVSDPRAAYFFEFNLGAQDAFYKSEPLRALFVRDGDVAAMPVPEPATASLVLAGLGLLAARRRLSKKRTF